MLCFHQEYEGLDGLSISDVVDLVEHSRETLDDVWRQTDFDPYLETRMVRLMDVVGVGSITCFDWAKPEVEKKNEMLTLSLQNLA